MEGKKDVMIIILGILIVGLLLFFGADGCLPKLIGFILAGFVIGTFLLFVLTHL